MSMHFIQTNVELLSRLSILINFWQNNLIICQLNANWAYWCFIPPSTPFDETTSYRFQNIYITDNFIWCCCCFLRIRLTLWKHNENSNIIICKNTIIKICMNIMKSDSAECGGFFFCWYFRSDRAFKLCLASRTMTEPIFHLQHCHDKSIKNMFA